MDSLGHVDVIVIGAGVVGLAVARALALTGREVLVLEAEDRIGAHSSGRNSEIVHAGIYYPPGSLKARLCVSGSRQLYDYMASHNISFQRTGKLIVATTVDELVQLESYLARAEANGVEDLRWCAADDVRRLEPALNAVAALWSPMTGIMDSHAYLLALRGDAESAGAQLALRARADRVALRDHGFDLLVSQGDVHYRVGCRALVNAAGLGAWAVARAIDGLAANKVPPAYYARGHYMTYSGQVPFRHLIYPVPSAGGLGIHLTLDLAGQARFGPDVCWLRQPDYTVALDLAPTFAEAIARYWPAVEVGRLRAGYAGIRPKLAGPGVASHDFLIQSRRQHGIDGLVQLFGIESPGLTASLAIADEVMRVLDN